MRGFSSGEQVSPDGEHPGVQITVVQFLDGKADNKEHTEVTLRPFDQGADDCTHELDKAAVAEFRQRMGDAVRFEECVVAGNVIGEVVEISRSREYGLVVERKGRLPSTTVGELAVRGPPARA